MLRTLSEVEISQSIYYHSPFGGLEETFTGVINLVLWSLVGFLLLVTIYYTVNQMGHKQISYISNGRVNKSDEIAEEEKYLRGRIE